MNRLQKIARGIIRMSFEVSVSTIEYFSDMNAYKEKVSQLRMLEAGTLGREIAICLDKHNLCLVPKYESHDLKHVILEFQMTPEDEIRMQAFMIGNGNYSIPSFVIFIFGSILLPDLWSIFYSDFKRGKGSHPISEWTIEELAPKNLCELRSQLEKPIYQPNQYNRIARYMSITSILAGIFGMTFCLPFLFSSNIADLLGAGFPFIGGAILIAGGLLALSNISRIERNGQVLDSLQAERVGH